MIEGRAATGLDRLPWLEDDADRPAASRRQAPPVAWVALLVVAVAALSYWLGARGWMDTKPNDSRPAPRSTLTLPDARPAPTPAEPGDLDVPGPQPQVDPIAQPPSPTVRTNERTAASARPAARPSATAIESETIVTDTEEGEETAEPAAPVQPRLTDFTPWPVREVEGASSRLVQVGTFKTRHQAKVGWKKLMRVNPSLQRLPALVVPVTSARNGQTYYRLQMGTTSQAHSAALCQKLRMISLSCVVIQGTPAKPVEQAAAE